MTESRFEASLRAALHRAIDPRLPAPGADESILFAVADAASFRRTRTRTVRPLLAIAVAVALFVLSMGVLGLALALRHQPATTPGPAISPPAVSAPVVPPCGHAGGAADCTTPPPVTQPPLPGPGSSSLLDLSWISEQTGWALGEAPCGVGVCAVLYGTDDGGHTWQRLADPPVSVPSASTQCPAAQCVTHVRFASATIGYLYGPALYVTTDAGRTWTAEQSPTVEALEPSAGVVYRLAYDHTGCPGPCQYTLWKTTPGSGSWSQIRSLQGSGDGASLTVVGGSAVYLALYGNPADGGVASQQTAIHRSLDGGSSWTVLPDPCGGSGSAENDAINLTAATGGFVAALCAPRMSPQGNDFTVTSSNSGSNWGTRHALPGSFINLIAAADSTHLIVGAVAPSGNGPTTGTLYASADGGVHWTTAAADPQTLRLGVDEPTYLGFESSRYGRWVDAGDSIWTTTDGGAHWTRTSFPG